MLVSAHACPFVHTRSASEARRVDAKAHLTLAASIELSERVMQQRDGVRNSWRNRMTGIYTHVMSNDGQVKGVVFQVRIGREAQGLIAMRNALDRVAEKNGLTDHRRAHLGIFVADETIESLDPDRGLELLWLQIMEEQRNSKGHEELGERDLP